jgi:hypothetical protein
MADRPIVGTKALPWLALIGLSTLSSLTHVAWPSFTLSSHLALLGATSQSNSLLSSAISTSPRPSHPNTSSRPPHSSPSVPAIVESTLPMVSVSRVRRGPTVCESTRKDSALTAQRWKASRPVLEIRSFSRLAIGEGNPSPRQSSRVLWSWGAAKAETKPVTNFVPQGTQVLCAQSVQRVTSNLITCVSPALVARYSRLSCSSICSSR